MDEEKPPGLPPETGYKHPDGHSHHLRAHEAADERTIGITLSGPLATDDGVCWLAESAIDPDMTATANSPGRALVRLGRKLDAHLACEGWRR